MRSVFKRCKEANKKVGISFFLLTLLSPLLPHSLSSFLSPFYLLLSHSSQKHSLLTFLPPLSLLPFVYISQFTTLCIFFKITQKYKDESILFKFNLNFLTWLFTSLFARQAPLTLRYSSASHFFSSPSASLSLS